MKTIRDGLYLSPNRVSAGLTDAAIMELTNGEGPRLAPKIMPSDRMIRRDEQSAAQILHRDKVLGEMWDSSLYRGLLSRALLQVQTLALERLYSSRNSEAEEVERLVNDAEGTTGLAFSSLSGCDRFARERWL